MALVEGKVGGAGTGVAERETPRSPAAVKVNNVLFATDFSPISEAAMPYATAICRRFCSTLHLAHVLSDTSLLMMTGGVDYVSMGTLYEDAHAEAEHRLDELTACLADIPHVSHVRHGQVWRSLAPIVEANQIDLIVVGTHGRGGLGKLLLGSVAESILRHAPCPVLTVGPRVMGRAKLPAFEKQASNLAPVELELGHILCATNFMQSAPEMVKRAVLLAEDFHAQLTLMHVLENYTDLGSRPGPMEESIRKLQELIPKDVALQHVPETVLEFGPTTERILKVALEREADMIILGARSAADVATTHLPWSSAHHVIAQAPCPVLTVRE